MPDPELGVEAGRPLDTSDSRTVGQKGRCSLETEFFACSLWPAFGQQFIEYVSTVPVTKTAKRKGMARRFNILMAIRDLYNRWKKKESPAI